MLFSSKQSQGNRQGCIDTDDGNLLCSFDTEGDASLSSLVVGSTSRATTPSSHSVGEQRLSSSFSNSNRAPTNDHPLAATSRPSSFSSACSSSAEKESEHAGRSERNPSGSGIAFSSGSQSRHQPTSGPTASSHSVPYRSVGKGDVRKLSFEPPSLPYLKPSHVLPSSTSPQASTLPSSSSSSSSSVPSSIRLRQSVGAMSSASSLASSTSAAASRYASQAGQLRKYRFAESRYFVSEADLEELKPDWLRRKEEAFERRSALGSSFPQGGRREGKRERQRESECVPWGETPDRQRPRNCCFLCFQDDHAHFQCKAKHLFCRLCAGFGHPEDACPLLLVEQSLRGELRCFLSDGPSPDGFVPASDSESGEGDRSSDAERGIRCLSCGARGHAICSEPPVTVLQLYCCRCGLYGHSRSDCPGMLSCVRASSRGRRGASHARFACHSTFGRSFSRSPSRAFPSNSHLRHSSHIPQAGLYSESGGSEKAHRRPVHGSAGTGLGGETSRAQATIFDERTKKREKKERKKEKKKERARAEKQAKHKERLREERKKHGKGSWDVHFGGHNGTEGGRGPSRGERGTWGNSANQPPAKRSKHRHRGLS
ncbi:conserved hypothetical protein [Neospora caninum Liverpool]|uniref:CCHC-type domain-containing protein n=1 Tax=Neospora caninum (strain Liverpool) TaxID=572307 RepID=F0V9C2_NEOCL|nr:conserved hypothetical protein [Neospora caninum Liverpool]CBZ50347.1 conserved hypothetical protein [Neospora caninum Liverpool]CEL64954.1 TPA: hypothetical protein BN1204_008180 [Neospora caninum Liverpool]|eukprot:XP_003880381.1 conserved hypothetical protein [Neospora caninum Liverpool]